MRAAVYIRVALVTLVIAFSVTGCGSSEVADVPVTPAPPIDDSTSLPPTTPSEPSPHAASFAYLEGIWAVTASLAEIDDPGLANTVSPPSGAWELVVLGDSMTAHLPGLRYEGVIEAGADGWMYLGFATGTTANGEMRMGTLEFSGTLSGDDAFSGHAVQSVDAEAGAPGYTARWELTGVRQP